MLIASVAAARDLSILTQTSSVTNCCNKNSPIVSQKLSRMWPLQKFLLGQSSVQVAENVQNFRQVICQQDNSK